MNGPTSAELLRSGVPAEAIECIGCSAPWDGTTPNARPACAAHRELWGQMFRRLGDLVMERARELTAKTTDAA